MHRTDLNLLSGSDITGLAMVNELGGGNTANTALGGFGGGGTTGTNDD